MFGRGGAGRPSVSFTISVDAEEDNWTPSTTGEITCRNIAQLHELSAFFRRLGLRATYFATYQVAQSPDAAAALRDVFAAGDAEVGAHLHPWNTPPRCGLESELSMLHSYPAEVQQAKIDELLKAIRDRIGVEPTAFRAGRFGIGQPAIKALIGSGVLVDSSVTPLMSWKEYGGPSFLNAPAQPYRLDGAGDVCLPVPGGELVEVPVSVGYTRFSPSSWARLARLQKAPATKRLRIAGLAERLGLVRRVILSPETESAEEMIRASSHMISEGMRHLHMYFHSSSLVPGLTPFARTAAESQRLYDAIEEYVESLSDIADLSFCTVSEAAVRYGASPRHVAHQPAPTPED